MCVRELSKKLPCLTTGQGLAAHRLPKQIYEKQKP